MMLRATPRPKARHFRIQVFGRRMAHHVLRKNAGLFEPTHLKLCLCRRSAKISVRPSTDRAQVFVPLATEPGVEDRIDFRRDLVDRSAYLAPGAVILGDVVIGAESSIWFNAVVRGDVEAIRVGRQTNIQDLCLLHADEGFPCLLGDRVTLGHGAIVHGAIVEDDCLIGMRSTIMNGAKIGSGTIVAAAAVVTEGTEIPPGSVVMGTPGKVKRAATEQDLQQIQHTAQHYVAAARHYAVQQSGRRQHE